MFRDSVIAAIRTGVAVAVGFVITLLVSNGLNLPEDFKANLTATVMILVTAGYNLLVGFLERRVNPLFGVLLGIPKAPAYGTVGSQTPATNPEDVDAALDYVSPDVPNAPVPPAK